MDFKVSNLYLESIFLGFVREIIWPKKPPYMNKIKTIVLISVYKSPQYEALGFRLIVERLIDMGYPATIREFEYDHTFSVR